MELDDALYQRVQKLSRQGNRHMDGEEWGKAVTVFSDALALLPPPADQWEAATWLYASIGDAHFQSKDYARAKDAFLDALNCPDGFANPFIQLRLGEIFFELGDHARAKDHLLRAYMQEGAELFQDEPAQYLHFLRQQVPLTDGGPPNR